MKRAPAFPPCGAVTALLRTSTAEQDTASQRLAIERWCRAYEVGEPVWIAEPDGTSGAADHRPALEHILAAARKGKIKTFLASEISRVGRLTGRTLAVLDELHKLEVRIVFPFQGLDYATDMGKLLAGILASVAEYERRLLIMRTRAGMERARANGSVIGRPTVQLTDEDVTIIRSLRALGWSCERIAAEAGITYKTAAGKVKTPSPTTIWKASQAPQSPATASEAPTSP